MCVPKHTPLSYHLCIWRPHSWGSDNDCDYFHLSFSSSAPSKWDAHSKSTSFRSWKDDKRLIYLKLYKYIILKLQRSQSQHNSQGPSAFFFLVSICFLFYPNPWKSSSFSNQKTLPIPVFSSLTLHPYALIQGRCESPCCSTEDEGAISFSSDLQIIHSCK